LSTGIPPFFFGTDLRDTRPSNYRPETEEVRCFSGSPFVAWRPVVVNTQLFVAHRCRTEGSGARFSTDSTGEMSKVIARRRIEKR
jgi:hypothetical protein